MRLPYHPRWLNRLYAFLANYFWLPCACCGRMFGGHEWIASCHTIWDKEHRDGKATCPRCPTL